MADEDTTEKPPDSDSKDAPVQPSKEEELEASRGRRADSIQVETVDGAEELAGVSSGKPSRDCGGCPVLTVIVLGVLIGNAFGLLLIYQRFYAGKSPSVSSSQTKATILPSLAPTSNQRRRSISEEISLEADIAKMTSLHLRTNEERRDRVRRMPINIDEEDGLRPWNNKDTIESPKLLNIGKKDFKSLYYRRKV